MKSRSEGRKDEKGFCEARIKCLVWAIGIITIAVTAGAYFVHQREQQGRKNLTRGQLSTSSQGQANVRANLSVDSVTKATPKGGFKLVAQGQDGPVVRAGLPLQQGQGPASPLLSPIPLENIQEVLNNIAATVKPAVVHIEVLRADSNRNPSARFESIGSGVIVDRRGYVLTNYHVLEDALRMTVTTFSKAGARQYDAKMVHSDIRADLAVLEIIGDSDFPVARLGDSSTVEVGDWALAMGSPLDLAQTVSFGIVSALRETVAINGVTYTDMIQTDAHINKGNSGGPLINAHGEVIGINTAIYTPRGAFTGVGFAIPVNAAKPLLDELNVAQQRFAGAIANLNKTQLKVLKKGSWFGIQGLTFSPELAARYGSLLNRGVYVTQVFADSPASRAGVQRGDIFVMFDQAKILSIEDLKSTLSRTPAGKEVVFRVCRSNRIMDLSAITTAKW